MPLFHVHGLVASTLSTFLSGGTVVVPEKFNPLSFWRTVRDYKRHVVLRPFRPSTSSSVARINERPEGVEGLRFVRSCSAALPPDDDGKDGEASSASRCLKPMA